MIYRYLEDGGTEDDCGDIGQCPDWEWWQGGAVRERCDIWSSEAVWGKYAIDLMSPVTIYYTEGNDGQKSYSYSFQMYVEDNKGTRGRDGIATIVRPIAPSRRAKLAIYAYSGKGECCSSKPVDGED